VPLILGFLMVLGQLAFLMLDPSTETNKNDRTWMFDTKKSPLFLG